MKKYLPAIFTTAVFMIAGCRDKTPVPTSALSAVKPDAAVCRQYQNDVLAAVKEFANWGMQYGNSVELLDKQGNICGYMLLATGKHKRIEGYNGYVNTAVLLSPGKKIVAVALGDHEETPSFINRMRKAGFMSKWNHLTPQEATIHKVDAVTRATYSSNAIAGEVFDACSEYSKNTQ